MSRVHMMCGMICAGKSTYAETLCRQPHTVSLSADELMLSLFEPYMGEAYQPMLAKAMEYLHRQAERLLAAGMEVVLDFGFWTPEERRSVRNRYERLGHTVLLHYLPITPEEWERRVDRRNAEVTAGKQFVYSLDENMRSTFPGRFQPPSPDEVDIWVQ